MMSGAQTQSGAAGGGQKHAANTNPFASANPFAAPAQPAARSATFPNPFAQNNTQTAPANPFARLATQQGASSAFGQTQFQSSQQSLGGLGQKANASGESQKNPFEKRKSSVTSSNSSNWTASVFAKNSGSGSARETSPFGANWNTVNGSNWSQLTPFGQPSWPKQNQRQVSTGTQGKRKNDSDGQKDAPAKRPAVTTVNVKVECFGPHSKSTAFFPKSDFGSRNTLGAGSESSDAFARRIQSQLQKDKVHPPRWPANPGRRSQRSAMEKLRGEHKEYREKARRSLIKAGLIDDPDQKRRLDDALDFKGTCETMCPEWEQITRILEFDIWREEKEDRDGEMVAIPELMIKRMARSAAGQETPLPMDVLSIPALRRTLDYLVDDILISDNALALRHEFLWDRTRSIRRDFTFQTYTKPPQDVQDQIYCFETIIRFHATAAHLLAQPDFAYEKYSEQQEIEQLSKSLLSLMHAYDDNAKEGVQFENETEFRAYFVVLNAHSPSLKETVQSWGPRFWQSDVVRTAISLVEAIQDTERFQGPLSPRAPTEMALNAASLFFSMIESQQVSYVMACFAEIHFNSVRRTMLQNIQKAYARPRDGPKDITPAFLKRRMRFDTEEDATAFVELHGMEFATDANGNKFLLISRQGFIEPRVPHAFTAGLVEHKRHGRTLPQVIHGVEFEEEKEEAVAESESDRDGLFVDGSQDAAPHAEVEEIVTPDSDAESNDSVSEPAESTPSAASAADTSEKTSSTPTATPMPPLNTALGSANSLGNPPASWSLGSTPSPSHSSSEPSATSLNFSATTTPIGLSTWMPWKTPESSHFPKHDSQQQGETCRQSPGSLEAAQPVAASSTSSIFGAAQPRDSLPAAPSAASVSRENPRSTLPSTSPGAAKPTVVDSSTTPPTPVFNMPEKAKDAASSSSPQQLPRSEVQQDSRATFIPPRSPEPAPRKDPMECFTRWFVLGDHGLMQDQLEPFIVEKLIAKVWDDFQGMEEARKRKEEDEESWAEARKFREYSLKVRYFYRWLDIFRKRRVVKRIQQEKEKARQWKLAEKVAKRAAQNQAARESDIDEMAELVRSRSKKERAEADAEAQHQLRRSARASQSLEDMILASGVLSGVRDERASARHAARGDSPDLTPDGLHSEAARMRTDNQRRRKHGLQPRKRLPEPKGYKDGSKTAVLRALASGSGRGSLSASNSSVRHSAFSSGRWSSLGPHNGRVSKAKTSRVFDPYWRMKASGLVLMPSGEYLPESLALPMLREGKRLPGLGNYGLSDADTAAPSPSPPADGELSQISPSVLFNGGADRSRASTSPSQSRGSRGQKRSRASEEAEAEADLAAYGGEVSDGRKRARGGDDGSLSSEKDFLSRMENMMQALEREGRKA